jgi:hypothetical protein
LWVDLYGYDVNGTPEKELTALVGTASLRSENGRYLFYNLEQYNRNLNSAETNRNRIEQIQSHPVEVTLERGFYSQQYSPGGTISSSQRKARIVLVNPLNVDRAVVVTATVQTNLPYSRMRIVANNSAEDRIVASTQSYSTKLMLPALDRAEIRFDAECRNSSGGCFQLRQLRIE